MSEDKVLSELTKIKGLNKKQAIKLFRAGVNSIKKLGSSNPDELAKLTGIAKKQMTTWIILARAQERKKFVEVDTAAAEISQLIEVKIEDAKRLVSSGVMTVDDLAEESADLLSEDTGLPAETIKKWIQKAKEVKKIPAEKRKVVVTPKVEGGSKLGGALFGSNSGFTNIYNSSSFGKSFFLVLFSALFFLLYISTSQATFFTSLWSTNIAGWSFAQIKYSFEIPWVLYQFGTMKIVFYPMVFLAGMLVVVAVWLLLGKIVANTKKLEFKNTSAVLGFALTPGFFVLIVIVAKFLPATILSESLRLTVLPILLVVFTLWVVIVFIRGLAFSPSGAATTAVAIPKEKAVSAAPKSEMPSAKLEIEEERPRPAPSVSPAVERKVGPVNLSEFNTIDSVALSALQKGGYNTSMDLLRASSKDIADATGIQQSKIIIWRIISDLLRIPGISIQHALILAKSGVRSVKHLTKINENALKVQVLDTISKENIQTNITAQMLADWIAKSKNL
jgi:hypothetical protein